MPVLSEPLKPLALKALAVLLLTATAVVAPAKAQLPAQQPEAQQLSPSEAAAPSTAGTSMAIAAVVNEDVITVYDVQSRLAMLLATSGLEDSAELRRRYIPQVVQTLILERLKLQEAKRLKIETSDAEVRQAVEIIEANNNMPPGAFRKMFEEKGIDMGSFMAQLESDVAWLKVVRQDISHDVTIAPEEVKTVRARLAANQGKPENEVSEIVLPINVNSRESDVRALAERLVQQARTGTAFAALARQFSQSPTAAVGGDLGWIVRGEMDEEVDNAVERMEPNEISDPIRTAQAYYIVQLKARRTSGAADPLMAVVTMSQLYEPTIGGRAPTPARQQQILQAVSTQVSNCDQMNKLAKEMGGPGSGQIEPLRIGMLPEKIRDALANLQPGHVTPPIELKGARLFAILCTRQDDSGLPSEEQVYSKLENDRLESLAGQRLRDLQRQALIDIRM